MTEKTLSTRRIFEGRALTVDILDITMPDGRKTTREVLRHRGAVCILCELAPDQFVFVRQYRKAVEQTLLECVAGCMEVGEKPEESALRETREESGYDVVQLTPLGKSLPAPGYCDEIHWLFHAQLKPHAQKLQLDSDENLIPVILSSAEIDAAIDTGELTDGKTIILWDAYRRAHLKGRL
ncbi:MAG: NUDIX hydrolase [Kiritimatiellia bacterium]